MEQDQIRQGRNQQEELQRHYESRSDPIIYTRWLARPWWRRTLENAVQVMSPLL